MIVWAWGLPYQKATSIFPQIRTEPKSLNIPPPPEWVSLGFDGLQVAKGTVTSLAQYQDTIFGLGTPAGKRRGREFWADCVTRSPVGMDAVILGEATNQSRFCLSTVGIPYFRQSYT